MGLKRLSLLVVLASLAVVVVPGAASAGSIHDGIPCPRGANNYLVCPVGTEGVSYSIRFRGDEDPICAPGDDKWYARNGTVPPGLTQAPDGTLSGTPTQAGTYTFWIHLELPDYWNGTSGCSSRDNSEEPVSVTIRPGIPKLIIGPEQSGVPAATVGTAYSLAMTANLSDPKTWSIVDGMLPPGTTLDASTGVIAGTPSTAGTYVFTVQAVIGTQQSDTKSLAITVRDALVLTFPELETKVGSRILWEVGVPFDADVEVTGGSGTYTWSLTGSLPPGVALGQDGTISGRPLQPGVFPFAIAVTDSEARVVRFAGRMVVSARLSLVGARLRPGMVGRLYRQKLVATGGVPPRAWRVVSGPLPRGVTLDRQLGVLSGVPRKAGRFRIRVEITDALGVKATRNYLLRVAPAPKKR